MTIGRLLENNNPFNSVVLDVISLLLWVVHRCLSNYSDDSSLNSL